MSNSFHVCYYSLLINLISKRFREDGDTVINGAYVLEVAND